MTSLSLNTKGSLMTFTFQGEEGSKARLEKG